jgi:metal-sulfur cluster biosynthetic enzyme
MISTADVEAALREVIDPEIGVNIVDLGLVYDIHSREDQLEVKMTMTTPACPMSEFLAGQAKQALQRRWPERKGIVVTLVWEPPWHPGLMSEAARRSLGW